MLSHEPLEDFLVPVHFASQVRIATCPGVGQCKRTGRHGLSRRLRRDGVSENLLVAAGLESIPLGVVDRRHEGWRDAAGVSGLYS